MLNAGCSLVAAATLYCLVLIRLGGAIVLLSGGILPLTSSDTPTNLRPNRSRILD